MKIKKIKLSRVLYLAIVVILVYLLNGYNDYIQPRSVDGELQVHFLDVDQSDCILVRTDDKNMLIDGGTDSESDTIISYLENLRVDKLDVVIATHPHEDHIGGLDDAIEMFGADTVYMPDVSADTLVFEEFLLAVEDCNVVFPKSGDSFSLGDAEITVIAPNSTSYKELNDYSIGIRLEYGENEFLFTGDAEALSEREMISSGLPLSADVYKVAHHGSKYSNSEAFIKLVSPSISVISCGAFNQYDFPHMVVVDRLSEYGQIYRTDINGTVVITSDGKNLEVQCDNN